MLLKLTTDKRILKKKERILKKNDKRILIERKKFSTKI